MAGSDAAVADEKRERAREVKFGFPGRGNEGRLTQRASRLELRHERAGANADREHQHVVAVPQDKGTLGSAASTPSSRPSP